MRAALYRRNGPAREVLQVTAIDRPEPGQGEVRVRVELSAVNPTDWKTRGGQRQPMDFPWVVPHQDGSGVIDAVGEGVEELRVGERVWMWLAGYKRQQGTAAEWICLPERQAVALPEQASFELGASMGVPAMTAHRCLMSDGPISGKTVLVAGGAGAVGHYAIELARHAGARVIATASTEEKQALACQAGAESVVDYRRDDAAEQLRAAAPDGVDRIVEVDPARNLELDLQLLHNDGTIMSYAAGDDLHSPVFPLMQVNARLRFMLLYTIPAEAHEQAVADISQALRASALSELPSARFTLDEIVTAHEAVESGAVGKVFIEL